jgi:peptidoglycan hydrolase-like protein with peptidoglycan-binding domain
MTSRQARTALAGFFLLAIGVAINVLYLQPGQPGSGREAADRSAPRQSVDRLRKPNEPAPAQALARPPSQRVSPAKPAEERLARLKPDAASVPSPALPSERDDTETVAAIQRELKQRGYAGFAADGTLTDLTRAAILAFEFDSGLPLLGEANEAILKRLLLGTSPGTDNAGAGTVRSPQADRLVRAAQQLLGALGYQPGPINGQLGAETRRAIREFELDKGLIPKGRISPEVMQRLKDSVAAARPAAR